MSGSLVDLVSRVLSRAREWVRLDLSSKKDLPVRRRAEETLAAMITAALEERADDHSGDDPSIGTD